MSNFFVKLSILTAILAAGLFFWNRSAPAGYWFMGSWWLLAVFYLVTVGVHAVLMNVAKKDPKTFVRGFMAVTGAKMFVYLLALVIYIFVEPKSAFVFTIHFLVFYITFLVAEVTLLMRALGRKQ